MQNELNRFLQSDASCHNYAQYLNIAILRVKNQSGLRVLFAKWGFVRVKKTSFLRVSFANIEIVRVMGADTLRVFSAKTAILRVKSVESLRVYFANIGFVRVMVIDILRVFSTKTAILRVTPLQKKDEPVSDGSEAGPGGKLLFYLYLSYYGYVVYLMLFSPKSPFQERCM